VTPDTESFEDKFKQLSEILARLEEGDLSLDACLKEYELGIAAVRNCRQILDKAERRIEELTPAGLEPTQE
jgi:exodeoxyribonuclease VII small subunit